MFPSYRTTFSSFQIDQHSERAANSLAFSRSVLALTVWEPILKCARGTLFKGICQEHSGKGRHPGAMVMTLPSPFICDMISPCDSAQPVTQWAWLEASFFIRHRSILSWEGSSHTALISPLTTKPTSKEGSFRVIKDRSQGNMDVEKNTIVFLVNQRMVSA